jgi:hypothetical protein
MSLYNEEEYTDYSCSTALERLSRDVETVLRTWHVDKGSDRHVSLAGNSNSNSNSRGTTEDPACPLIRSNTLVWHIPVTTRQGRTSVTVDLELALWDAPGTQTGTLAVDMDEFDPPLVDTSTATAAAANTSASASADDSATSPLVKSLQRQPFGKMPAHDFLFDNFARLFGIGQHISLSPIQPDPVPTDLVEFLGISVLERHDDQATAPFVFAATLTAWLQSALNCATSNCQCAIPAFGVWGVYRPNELHRDQTHQAPSKKSNISVLINGSASATAANTITNTTARSSSHNGDTSMHSALNGASHSDYLLGTTIQTKDAPSTQQSHGSTATTAPPRPPPRGIPVFPQWAQALRQANLPPVARTYKRRAQHSFWNSQFIPPLVCGRVTGNMGGAPLDTPTTAATMWVSATSSLPRTHDQQQKEENGHHTLAASSRLAIWGSVLLQHCPKDDSTCILTGARHVFGWFKPNANEAPKNLLFGKSNADFLASLQEWRFLNTALTQTPKPDDSEFVLYKKDCQAHAMDLLKGAWEQHQTKNFSFRKVAAADGYYDYQQQQQQSSSRPPVWGPVDDPVASVYATTTWSGARSSTTDGAVEEPLLTFPLRIRSRRPVSKKDWIDMEESVERTILDPLSPTRFVVQVYYDRDASVAMLAANQRCVLSALIRSATLPGETLLHHLTDPELVALWDDDAGRVVAQKLASHAKVGNATQQIVQAMDWSSCMEEMITMQEAEAIVHAVMKGGPPFPSSPEEAFLPSDDLCLPFRKGAPFGRLLSLLFAHLAKLRALSSMSLVWGVFCQELRRRWDARESLPNMHYVAGLDPHPLELYERRCFSSIGQKANFSAFLNGNEPDPDDFHCLIGQKLQVFQVGVECIVARELLESEVMEAFLEQGQVPASAKVDTPPGLIRTTVDDDEETEDHRWRPVGSDKLPLEKHYVEQGTEAPPGKVIIESSKTKRKWPKAAKSGSNIENGAGEKKDYGPPAINSDLEFWVMDQPGYAPRDAEGMDFTQPTTDDTGFDFVVPAPSDLEDVDADESVDYQRRRASMAMGGTGDVNGWEGTIMEDTNSQEDEGDDEGSNDSEASRTTNCSLSQAYFDAAEAGSIFSMKHGFVTLDTVVNVADMKRRPGARCPVHNRTLAGTGDQLYAPYLQRPCPLTDDLVLERKYMLASEQREGESRKAVLQARIELAHRLQRPKLLSDMSAFKAANPNATIDDFTKWYGNPGSPLDEYDDIPLPDDASLSGAYYASAAKKLDQASEAMKVLMATRDFWATTWEQATAVPAAEQQPLFDFESTVEVAIDYLEQMHPANLVNQVMAVNLSSAYFALVSAAEDALKVGLVRTGIEKLRKKIDRALQLLSDDATGALFQSNNSDNASTATATANQYISEESIYACEDACNSLSVTETMLARVISLLSKFPSQYTLVQDLLKLSDGTTVALTDPVGRKGFLNAIHQQQKHHSGFATANPRGLSDSLPQPVLREYVLRNLDDDKPCQLAVRFGDSGAYLGRVDNEGGVLLAILKSYTD